ncbi:MAG: hypothetical protein K6F77_03155 [Lachnospiraceae bacterium]|nr:hypothetical protein [Lachnospiraceae bacterium]
MKNYSLNKNVFLIKRVLFSLIMVLSLSLFVGCSSKKDDDKGSSDEDVVYDGKIPVYSKDDADKITDFLSGLPDKPLTYDEEKELGIIVDASTVDESYRQELFEEMCDFRDATSDDATSDTTSSIKKAIVILLLNEDNKPVYVYISYVDGKFLMYEYDGFTVDEEDRGSVENYLCSFNKLMSFEDSYTDGTEYTAFYLVSDDDMTEKELKENVEKGGYNYTDIFWIYDVNKVAKAAKATKADK